MRSASSSGTPITHTLATSWKALSGSPVASAAASEARMSPVSANAPSPSAVRRSVRYTAAAAISSAANHPEVGG